MAADKASGGPDSSFCNGMLMASSEFNSRVDLFFAFFVFFPLCRRFFFDDFFSFFTATLA